MKADHPYTQFLKRWRLWLLVLFVAFVVGLGLYIAWTRYSGTFHIVVKGDAYRSGQMDVDRMTRTLKLYGIKSILNLRGENPTANWYQTEIETAAKLKVLHYDRQLGSGRELTLEQMDDLVALLRQAPKPILIHCVDGADRSGLVSALYRLALQGNTPEEAHRELSIWYGHVPLFRPKVKAMDRSYWRYVSNHAAAVEQKLLPAPSLP